MIKKSKEKTMRLKADVFPADYAIWVSSLKKRIAGARQKALLSANAEQIKLYHEIGRDILDRQNKQGWGRSALCRFARGLSRHEGFIFFKS